MKISNSTLIVLSSATAVSEIMDKNSAIVSDRPASHFAEEITGGNHMGASRYSKFLPFSENDLCLNAPQMSNGVASGDVHAKFLPNLRAGIT